MKLTFKTQDFAVFDDVLSGAEMKSIWRYMQSIDLDFQQTKRWIKVIRLTDGNFLAGNMYTSEKTDLPGVTAAYPTGTGIDPIVRAMLDNVESFEPWIGKKGKEWNCFTCRPYVYPYAGGLSWHRDPLCGGAFIVYVHPYWNSQWCGQLMIAHSPPDSALASGSTPELDDDNGPGPHLDNSAENAILMESGVGNYVLPKPNRLVIIAPELYHMISKVDISAGDHCRCTISGFFLR